MKALLPLVQLEEQGALRRDLAKETRAQRLTESMQRRLESADLRAERIAARRPRLLSPEEEEQQIRLSEARIASPREPKPTSVQEYEYAKEQGFKGSFEDWKKQGGGGSDPATIQEYRLAQKQGYKGSFEDWKKLIAVTYGPGFRELTTPEGRTIYIHPSTGRIAESPEGTRPQYTAAEREEIGGFDEILAEAKILRGIANENRGSIGVIQGTASDIKRKLVGSTPAVNDLFRLSDSMAARILYLYSGAQINETEYNRLRGLVPNPRQSEDKFFNDLNSFEAEVKRVMARRSGAAPLITPQGGGGTGGQGGGQQREEFSQSRNQYRHTLDGGTTWRSGRLPK
jgi:hypothetical protein